MKTVAWLGLMWLVTAVGCNEDTPIPYRLSWTFADGLDCAELGVTSMRLTLTASRVSEREVVCAEGLHPEGLELGPFDPSLVLFELEALSPTGSVLYRGTARVAMREGAGEREGVVVLERVEDR